MKIFHLSLREFETLNKDHADQLVFQEKTYVKGDAFSERVYDRVIENLHLEGNDLTSCLVVDMDGGYFVWREVKLPEGVAEEETPESIGSEEIANLIAFSIDQVIEEIFTHKQPITLEFFSDRLKNPELAQKIFAKLQEMGTLLQIAEFLEPANQASPQARTSRIYRGVSY
ncbi:hypothetical protein [Leptolyngbya sp. NIES-2104]|uniref:hypothetical protein n=1 Tax=Leptolyngbya sp. NIES-2104 TaxID=1552121 RepID=UPI0006EC6730|nr:hypothetical protein [Leptolyngbya sp. NIES-2104]GAP95577.1 hypothetical protein NIES2104_21010 [Leptolyngbya sp. NIES-2104]